MSYAGHGHPAVHFLQHPQRGEAPGGAAHAGQDLHREVHPADQPQLHRLPPLRLHAGVSLLLYCLCSLSKSRLLPSPCKGRSYSTAPSTAPSFAFAASCSRRGSDAWRCAPSTSPSSQLVCTLLHVLFPTMILLGKYLGGLQVLMPVKQISNDRSALIH